MLLGDSTYQGPSYPSVWYWMSLVQACTDMAWLSNATCCDLGVSVSLKIDFLPSACWGTHCTEAKISWSVQSVATHERTQRDQRL